MFVATQTERYKGPIVIAVVLTRNLMHDNLTEGDLSKPGAVNITNV